MKMNLKRGIASSDPGLSAVVRSGSTLFAKPKRRPIDRIRSRYFTTVGRNPIGSFGTKPFKASLFDRANRRRVPRRFAAYLDEALVVVSGVLLIWAATELLRSSIADREKAGREAAREYDRDVKEFGASGQVEARAQEAKEALEGPEAESMKQAEEAGQQRSRGDDPRSKR
jgi:hypothetical protein